MARSSKNIRDTLYFGDANGEAIKLIAKLGAAPEETLRRALEDQQESRLGGRWSRRKLIIEIVRRLEWQLCSITSPGTERSMEEILIAHGLWAGAKRST